MARLENSKVSPVLRIFDLAKAREFYLDWLGFQVDWEHRFEPDMPLYMQISMGDIVLHLSEHHGDCCPGAKVFIETHGLEAYHAELIAKNYRYSRPGLEISPWNARTVLVGDPFGNRLLFSEPLQS